MESAGGEFVVSHICQRRADVGHPHTKRKVGASRVIPPGRPKTGEKSVAPGRSWFFAGPSKARSFWGVVFPGLKAGDSTVVAFRGTFN